VSSGDGTVGWIVFRAPNENVLPAARREKPEGTAAFCGAFGCACDRASCAASSEEEDGKVEDEPNLAEEDASYGPPVEAEFWVPPLPLSFLLAHFIECRAAVFYRFNGPIPPCS
jgi:hypothetical protein